jgi:hypothetical protein
MRISKNLKFLFNRRADLRFSTFSSTWRAPIGGQVLQKEWIALQQFRAKLAADEVADSTQYDTQNSVEPHLRTHERSFRGRVTSSDTDGDTDGADVRSFADSGVSSGSKAAVAEVSIEKAVAVTWDKALKRRLALSKILRFQDAFSVRKVPDKHVHAVAFLSGCIPMLRR